MKTALAAALGAALLLSGCSLTIDPEGVKPPPEPPAARGACIEASGAHRLCGGDISAGASARLQSSGAHAVGRGTVGAGAVPQISNSQHQIVQGGVSP